MRARKMATQPSGVLAEHALSEQKSSKSLYNVFKENWQPYVGAWRAGVWAY